MSVSSDSSLRRRSPPALRLQSTSTSSFSTKVPKYWPTKVWNARGRLFLTKQKPKARSTATDSLATVLATCPPREAGAPPPRKTRPEQPKTYDLLHCIPEAAKGTIDFSVLSQETTLIENAQNATSRPKSPKDAVNTAVSKTREFSLSPGPATESSASSSSSRVLQTAQSKGTSFDVMAAWSHFVAPAGTPDSMATDRRSFQATEDIRDAMPDASTFLSMTQQIVASIQQSSHADVEMNNAKNQLRSSPVYNDLNIGEQSMEEGTVLPSSSPISARPLPRPPTAFPTGHVPHDELSGQHARSEANVSQAPTPQSCILPYPPLRLSPDTRTRALLEHIRGFKEICEELEYASDTETMLNELKWALKVNPATVDFATKQYQAFDPHSLQAVPEPVHIGLRWAQAVEVMTELSIRIRRFSEGARDCIEEIHTENFLLKRRVCEMEAVVDVLPRDVEELREKVKKLETSLDMVLNSGMHNVTSTRMVDHSLDRVSKAMQQTPTNSKQRASSRPRPQTPYIPRVRQPLGEVPSSAQPSTLRRPIYNGWKRNHKYMSPVRTSTSTDENVEDELMAAWELQHITRLVRPAPLRICKTSDDTEKDVLRRVSGHDENLNTSGRAVLDPADEAAFDNDSQIW